MLQTGNGYHEDTRSRCKIDLLVAVFQGGATGAAGGVLVVKNTELPPRLRSSGPYLCSRSVLQIAERFHRTRSNAPARCATGARRLKLQSQMYASQSGWAKLPIVTWANASGASGTGAQGIATAGRQSGSRAVGAHQVAHAARRCRPARANARRSRCNSLMEQVHRHSRPAGRTGGVGCRARTGTRCKSCCTGQQAHVVKRPALP